MTEDKLIALSDLNREDNIKYISSEAQGIAISLDSDKYAPTLCKLERAYICGRRKSEEQIKELNKKIKNLRKTYRKQRNKRIDDLQKENSELKARLNAINLLTPELEKTSKLRRQQLTYAKELISEYINILKGDTKNWKNTQEKAEQFLNNNTVIDFDEYKDREYDE